MTTLRRDGPPINPRSLQCLVGAPLRGLNYWNTFVRPWVRWGRRFTMIRDRQLGQRI